MILVNLFDNVARQKEAYILPNSGISDPDFLRVNRNFRFSVRICQLYRDYQQLQLNARSLIINVNL